MSQNNWDKICSSNNKKVWIYTDDRFMAMTWKIENTYQCKIYIKYNHMIEGKKYISFRPNDEICINLSSGKTREEANSRALEWIKTFKIKGVLSANKLFKKCMKEYPNLFSNRIAILSHLFFTGGNGYDWLDGSIIKNNQSAHLEMKIIRKKNKESDDVVARIKETRRVLISEPKEDIDDEASYYNSLAKTDKYMFYPVSREYSKICHVPDDVTSSWLKISYEAAILLRDKSGIPILKSKYHNPTKYDIANQLKNSEIGAEVVFNLEKRFPNVKKV